MKRTFVVALLALAAVAVTSFAYAAIPSANGSISACKDSKGSLKVIDAETGQTCNGNQQLLTWNQQGPAGQDGLSGYQMVTAESAFNSVDYKQVVASCPSGKIPVGGGGAATGSLGFAPDPVAIQGSRPGFVGATWVVTANEIVTTDSPWTLTAHVICATAS